MPGPDQVVSYGLPAYVVSVLNSTTVLCSCSLRFACHVHACCTFLNVFFVFWALSMWSVQVCFSIILLLSQKDLLPSLCMTDIFCWFGERLGIYQMCPFFCCPLSPALVGALVMLDCLVSPTELQCCSVSLLHHLSLLGKSLLGTSFIVVVVVVMSVHCF